MKYTLASGNFFEITRHMNEMLKVGWVPQGGIFTDGKGQYVQALIKIEENGESS